MIISSKHRRVGALAGSRRVRERLAAGFEGLPDSPHRTARSVQAPGGVWGGFADDVFARASRSRCAAVITLQETQGRRRPRCAGHPQRMAHSTMPSSTGFFLDLPSQPARPPPPRCLRLRHPSLSLSLSLSLSPGSAFSVRCMPGLGSIWAPSATAVVATSSGQRRCTGAKWAAHLRHFPVDRSRAFRTSLCSWALDGCRHHFVQAHGGAIWPRRQVQQVVATNQAYDDGRAMPAFRLWR